MMNDKKAYVKSKFRDQELVDLLRKNGVEARLATEDEDKREKWDILARDFRIDTKYPNARLNQSTNKPEMWFEYSKICGPATRKVDQLWYFIQGEHACKLFFKREDIIRFLAAKYDAGQLVLEESNNSKSGIDSSDRICYVALEEVEKLAFARGVEEWIQKTS